MRFQRTLLFVRRILSNLSSDVGINAQVEALVAEILRQDEAFRREMYSDIEFVPKELKFQVLARAYEEESSTICRDDIENAATYLNASETSFRAKVAEGVGSGVRLANVVSNSSIEAAQDGLTFPLRFFDVRTSDITVIKSEEELLNWSRSDVGYTIARPVLIADAEGNELSFGSCNEDELTGKRTCYVFPRGRLPIMLFLFAVGRPANFSP